MIDLLKNHISIRKFSSKRIEQNLLREIVHAGCRASTTGNMQLYSIIATTSEEIKEKLLPLHFNQKMVVQAPVVLTFCADFHRFKKWCELSRAVPGYDNFLSFMTAAIDTLLVAQNVCVAAESKGLGICYLGTTIYNANEIADVLNLPKSVIPITTIAVGWPSEIPVQTDRLPIEAILHQEMYNDYTDERIREYYREKEEKEDNQRFVLENDKETLSQVFTDVRYKKVDNEFFSQKFFEVIKSRGFFDSCAE